MRSEQIARGILLTLLFTLPAIICLRKSPGSDSDIWWHLRAGQWILEHHAFPWTDPFSRQVAGQPWQAYSWLFELIVLKLFTRFGLMGLTLYTTAMVLATTAALSRLAARLQTDFSLFVLLIGTVAICMAPLGTPRPWHFTILLFIVQLDILERTRLDGRWKRLLWLLPMYALWANVHIQFINGLVVLGAAVLEPILMRWWPWPAPVRVGAGKLALLLAGCVLATLANPYGWHIYQVAYTLASQPGVLDVVTELEALSFRGFPDFLILGITIAAFATMCWKKRLPLWHVLLMVMAAYLSFRSRRDVWIVLSTATMVLAAELSRSGERAEDEPSAGNRGQRRSSVPLPWTGILLIALGTLCSVFGAGLFLRISSASLQKQVEKDLPAMAVQSIRSHHYPGPLFNGYDWGGFLSWQLRMPVSMDGRAGLYGDKLIDRSRRTWDGQTDWYTDPQLQTARLVVAPVSSPLTQLLRTDRSFRLTYEDKLAAVFVRDGSMAEVPPQRNEAHTAGR